MYSIPKQSAQIQDRQSRDYIHVVFALPTGLGIGVRNVHYMYYSHVTKSAFTV